MKLPKYPPNTDTIFSQLMEQEPQKALRLLSGEFNITDPKGRYLHWDKLYFLPPPSGYIREEWWAGIKIARKKLFKVLPFQDSKQNAFKFLMPDSVLRDLHWLDQNSTGSLNVKDPILNKHMKNTYIMRSLVEESITSSQLEGASTTWKVAREMLRQGRTPTDKSEQMIYNNFHAMQFIREHIDAPLTPEFILELHRIVTDKTLDASYRAGCYRSNDDQVLVVNDQQEILHTPPCADTLPQRIQTLCDFANSEDELQFIHPVIKAIILHFMLAYDHPFVDGNGRTARALFYWSMARQSYWIMEFISISQVIKLAPIQYGRAYLLTESDDNDLTYFIIHQLEVIKQAIDHLHHYIDKKTSEINHAKDLLENASKFKGQLNYRQLALLKHALKHPGFVYKINEHQNSHGIAYDTARTDLLIMAEKYQFLVKKKVGKTFVFESPQDLEQKIT